MTTQPTPTWKHRAPFVALAFITIGLSSWGLFHLFHDFAAMPWGFACLVVGGLDLFAVVCGSFAVMVAGDGDSPVGWNLLLVTYTAAAAYAQFTHAALAGDPPVIGWLMAAFPLATVLLFEGQLRRAARLQGRARGTVAAPRRRVPLLVWAHFPVETWHANRRAIRALGHLEEPAAKRVRLRRTELNRTKAIEPAPNEEARNGHDRPQTVAVPSHVEANVRETAVPPSRVEPKSRPVRASQSVAGSTWAAASRMDTQDVNTIWEEVKRTTHPSASKEAVRKALSRPQTNGHKELTDV